MKSKSKKDVMDPEEELINMLSEELAKKIDCEIMDGIMTTIIEDEIKITNRDRKIESVVDDKDYVEMKKEDHPYFKKNIRIYL
jgi:transcriptional regulator CtsR